VHLRAPALAILLTATPLGCAHADGPKPLSEKIGGRVSRGVVDESLAALDEEENRARLGRIMGSPQLRTAMHDLTAEIVVGAFDGVRRATVDAAWRKLDVGKSIGDAMEDHIAPAAGKLTHRIVDAAVSASLADQHIAQIEKLGRRTTHAVLAGAASGLRDEIAPALAIALDRDIGPAVGRMLERDILPAVGRGLDSPEMQSAVANLTRTVATGLVSGTDDAMEAERAEDKADGTKGGLQVFGSSLAIGYAVALFVAFALGTALIVLTVIMVRNSRRQRIQQTEAKRREETLMHLLDSIETDHPELRTDMRKLVREQLDTQS
jgi:hypothetical protein